MLFTHVDHLGIAVTDLEAALTFYRDTFGVTAWEVVELPERHMRAAVADIAGTLIELLAPTSDEAAFATYLRERGPGMHHVAYRVADIRAALDDLRGQGLRLIDDEPRPGLHGKLTAFLHPKATQGVLIELVQY